MKQGSGHSSGAEAATSGFISSADMHLGVPMEFQLESQDSCGDMQVCYSLELEKHCQSSCRVDIGIGGFFSWCHRAVTSAMVF